MVVYGNDARVEWDAIPVARQNLCGAIGTLVRRNYLTLNAALTHYTVNYPLMQTLDQSLLAEFPAAHAQVNAVPPNPVRFANQRKFGFATAFVVAPNTIVSAGHAVWDDQAAPGLFEGENLNDMRFVIGYVMNGGNPPAQIRREQVYALDRMLMMTSQHHEQPGLPDFTVITLERNVEATVPLLNFSTTPPPGNRLLWTAGFPRGLPLKYGEGSTSPYNLTNNNLRVRHNLTTFPGASGSPIFNANNEVVAIHVRGASNPGFVKYVQNAGGLISCPAYQAQALDETTWAEGFRTDYIRWLFNPAARIVFDVRFDATAQSPPDNAPCRVQLSAILNHNLNQLQPANIVLPPCDLGQGVRSAHIDATGPLNAGLAALGLLPVAVRGLNIQLLGPGGAPLANARRLLVSIGMEIGSSVGGREGIEYVNFNERLQQARWLNPLSNAADVFFRRVLIEPIHF